MDNTPRFSTKLGNRVQLDATNARSGVRLLAASLSEMGVDPLKSSGWVLTVRPDDSSNPLLAIAAIVRVGFGAGAASSLFEASLFPGFSIQVPGDSVYVDVGTFSPIALGAGSCTATAFLQPGFSDAVAKRGVFSDTLIGFGNGGFAANQNMLLPPFAYDVGPYSTVLTAAEAWYAAAGSAFEFLRSPATVLQAYTGAQLLSFVTSGARIPVPAGATGWRVPVVGTSNYCDFGVRL